MILIILILSARAQEDSGAVDTVEGAEVAELAGEADQADTSPGFLSSPGERKAIINALSNLLIVVLGGGGLAGAAAVRRRVALPASSVAEITDPRMAELLTLVTDQAERIDLLEAQHRSDPRTDLLIEQQHQIDRALNQTATMVELMYDSLSMAPKLAAAQPEEITV